MHARSSYKQGYDECISLLSPSVEKRPHAADSPPAVTALQAASHYRVVIVDGLLERSGQPLHAALFFQVDHATLIRRLAGRRICTSCGAIYNIYFAPSHAGDRCERCGGLLIQRSDDAEATVVERLKVYEHQTAPLLTFYRDQGKLRVIAAAGEI